MIQLFYYNNVSIFPMCFVLYKRHYLVVKWQLSYSNLLIMYNLNTTDVDPAVHDCPQIIDEEPLYIPICDEVEAAAKALKMGKPTGLITYLQSKSRQEETP